MNRASGAFSYGLELQVNGANVDKNQASNCSSEEEADFLVQGDDNDISSNKMASRPW